MRLIDPPVNVISPLANIRTWITDLERELETVSDEDRADVQRALEQARGWLELRATIGPADRVE